ncbi:MAG: hypothetical protein V9G11_09325 [Bifidobacterium adolescentis]
MGASDMQVSVSIPLVADHPALYGAAEVGLRQIHRQSADDSSPTKHDS